MPYGDDQLSILLMVPRTIPVINLFTDFGQSLEVGMVVLIAKRRFSQFSISV